MGSSQLTLSSFNLLRLKTIAEQRNLAAITFDSDQQQLQLQEQQEQQQQLANEKSRVTYSPDRDLKRPRVLEVLSPSKIQLTLQNIVTTAGEDGLSPHSGLLSKEHLQTIANNTTVILSKAWLDRKWMLSSWPLLAVVRLKSVIHFQLHQAFQTVFIAGCDERQCSQSWQDSLLCYTIIRALQVVPELVQPFFKLPTYILY